MKECVIFLVLLQVLASCTFRSENDKNKVSVFVNLPPDKCGNVKLWVNDTVKYDDSFVYQKDCEFYNDMLVAKIDKSNKTYKFKVILLDSDTIFYYKMENVDSIRISLENNQFYIFDNRDLRRWLWD